MVFVTALLARLLRYMRASIPSGPDGLVWWLVLLASMGVTAVLPILPLYAKGHGADLNFIGLMVGAYMAAQLLSLYPVGWLSDRWGRKPLMAIGLAGYALCSVGFLLVAHPWAFAVLRALEGVAGACLLPVAMAYVADRAPESQRGSRLAQISVAENMGLLLGPIVGGSLAAGLGLASPFAALGVLCGLGALLVPRLPNVEKAAPAEGAIAEPDEWRAVRWSLVAGLGTRSLATGFSIGLYETIWSIFLQDRGGTTWHISMTWTLFAVLPILLGPLAGRLIDRFGPGPAAVLGASFSSLVVITYPLSSRMDVLLGLSMLEGIGFAFSYPANNALMIQAGPMALRGRLIGVFWGIRTVGAMGGAVMTPWLYGKSAMACFGVTGAVLLGGALALGLGIGFSNRREASRAQPSEA